MKAGGAAQAHVAARPPADRGPPLLLLQLGALKLGDPESAVASLTALESILRLIGTQYHSEASLVLSSCDHLHQHALIHWVMQSLGHLLPHPQPLSLSSSSSSTLLIRYHNRFALQHSWFRGGPLRSLRKGGRKGEVTWCGRFCFGGVFVVVARRTIRHCQLTLFLE